jgi:putative N6-adenine-specific DNA methylase
VVAENKKIEDNKNHSIYASDISSETNRLARKNLARARMMNNISLEKIPFEQLKPKNEKGILIFNPPYNVRIEVEDIISFYQNIGNHLKHNFKGHDAWIISSDKTAIKHIGLKPSKKIILFNGPLESYFYKFSCY